MCDLVGFVFFFTIVEQFLSEPQFFSDCYLIFMVELEVTLSHATLLTVLDFRFSTHVHVTLLLRNKASGEVCFVCVWEVSCSLLYARAISRGTCTDFRNS